MCVYTIMCVSDIIVQKQTICILKSVSMRVFLLISILWSVAFHINMNT